MLRSLATFSEELRAIGIPVSMVETGDAAQALAHTDLSDEVLVRESLATTMIKRPEYRPAFDVAFDVFFSVRGGAGSGELPPTDEGSHDKDTSADGTGGQGIGSGVGGVGAGGGGAADDAVLEALFGALRDNDDDSLRRGARSAVKRFGGVQPGRPVGGRYYFYRVMRRIEEAQLAGRLRAAFEGDQPRSSLDDRLLSESVERRMDTLRSEVRREIVRQLVDDRGADAVAKTLRVSLVEDLDLTNATSAELADIERAVRPLARKIASKIAARRKQSDRGRLDVRRTVRRSLAHGGALIDPVFRPRTRSKPEVIVLADVSGSMATFARFTLQLTHALASQFSGVKTFAFVDEIDDVSAYFRPGVRFVDALQRMTTEAAIVGLDGHSDYGAVLRGFEARYIDVVHDRSVVLIAGDGRSNFRDPYVTGLHAIVEKARSVHWLNPEPARYWDTGDSIIGTYAPLIDQVAEVRTLRQLEHFVEHLVLDSRPRRRIPAARL
jgi:uncharacterized protein